MATGIATSLPRLHGSRQKQRPSRQEDISPRSRLLVKTRSSTAFLDPAWPHGLAVTKTRPRSSIPSRAVPGSGCLARPGATRTGTRANRTTLAVPRTICRATCRHRASGTTPPDRRRSATSLSMTRILGHRHRMSPRSRSRRATSAASAPEAPRPTPTPSQSRSRRHRHSPPVLPTPRCQQSLTPRSTRPASRCSPSPPASTTSTT